MIFVIVVLFGLAGCVSPHCPQRLLKVGRKLSKLNSVVSRNGPLKNALQRVSYHSGIFFQISGRLENETMFSYIYGKSTIDVF